MNFMRLSLFVNQCTTIQYVNSLKVACDTLREIIAILGPIRVDSVEGGNGLKVTPPPLPRTLPLLLFLSHLECGGIYCKYVCLSLSNDFLIFSSFSS
jgi:hypothetical protein